MSATVKSLGIDQLALAERLLLVEEIGDSIAADAERTPLTAVSGFGAARRGL